MIEVPSDEAEQTLRRRHVRGGELDGALAVAGHREVVDHDVDLAAPQLPATIAYGDLLDKDPRRAVEKAVWGMLPKNRLGRQVLKKLKVYAGPHHPHQAQQPQPFEITQISQ